MRSKVKYSSSEQQLVGGRGVHYDTVTVPYGHGSKERGELWIDGKSDRFVDVMGCPPYYREASGSKYVVFSREVPRSSYELVFYQYGEWPGGFRCRFPRIDFGCDDTSAKFEAGIVKITTHEREGDVVLSFDMELHSLVSREKVAK